jgi:hypothetical protein
LPVGWGEDLGQMKKWLPAEMIGNDVPPLKVSPQRDNAHAPSPLSSRMKESRDWLTRCVISMTAARWLGKGHLVKA